MARTSILDDVDRTLTQEARDAVADLVLAWAGYDTMVSYWMMLTFNLDLDVGSILLGNMDTKTKLDRMKALFVHMGADKAAASIERLSKAHLEFVDARNAVAHRRCIGMQKSDPCRLLFTSVKHVRKDVGAFEMLAVDVNMLKAGAQFANEAVDKIMAITKPQAEQREAEAAQRKARSEQSPEG
jgi:hypothetical protein